MPYVFISHLSDDNARLAVYVARLLERLDPGIDLWIDTPELIRADFGLNPRIKAIPPGSEWSAQIETAVEGAACVLAFWSANFPLRKRNVFIREIDRGRKYDCCVQVAIDPKDDCKIDPPFSEDQILDVIDIEHNQAHSTIFNRVIDKIKELIFAPLGRGQQVRVEPDKLPYLADRLPQIRPICRTVRQKSKAVTDRPTGPRPSLFVVPCRQYDRTDTFGWRLTSKDGPEYFDFDVSRDTPEWVKEENIHWPNPSDPRSFAGIFKSLNEDAVSDALKKSRLRKRPVCFSTWIDISVIENQLRAFVSAWISVWPELLAVAAQKIEPADVRSRPQFPIVALLFLRFQTETGFVSRWFGNKDARLSRYCDEMDKLELEPTLSSVVDFRVLDPLAQITRDDADTWLASNDVAKAQSYLAHANDAVDRLFDRAGVAVPMNKFASALLSQGK